MRSQRNPMGLWLGYRVFCCDQLENFAFERFRARKARAAFRLCRGGKVRELVISLGRKTESLRLHKFNLTRPIRSRY